MNNQKDLLHYQFHQLEQSTTQPTLVFLHGLFGDMNNLGVIARAFINHYPILRIDLRNHGKSFHSNQINYHLMAQDLLNLLTYLQLNKVILIGHSMGGKTAMKTAILQPELVDKLIIIDIAPVIYDNHDHDNVFTGLLAVKNAAPQTRQQAKSILAQYIQEETTLQFILKSFQPNSSEYFCFNLSILYQKYPQLMDWQPGYFTKPTLFIKGGLSDYISSDYHKTILTQFPQANYFTINGSGHWVHAEKSEAVIRIIKRFLV